MTNEIKTIDREKYMSEEELLRLRKNASWRASKGREQAIRRWAMIDVVTSTGLRVSELAALNVGNYFGESKRPYLKVWTKKQRTPKLDTVPIPESTVMHLEEYLRWRHERGESIELTEPLLTGCQRQRYKVRNLQYMFENAVRLAGLKHYSIHSARHTMGFLLLRKTKNLRLVQKQLRHANPQMTAAFYADVAFEDQQVAVNELFKHALDE